MKSVIIVPSYNSNDSLDTLIQRIKDSYSIDIVVIDDGSIPQYSSTQSSVTVIRNRVNRGKGYSLRKAFDFVFKNGYTHAITLDADLQHSPDEIQKFLDVSPEYSLVLGMRKRDRSMPLHRRFSNLATSYIISKIIQI